jgi:hypothetical protein
VSGEALLARHRDVPLQRRRGFDVASATAGNDVFAEIRAHHRRLLRSAFSEHRGHEIDSRESALCIEGWCGLFELAFARVDEVAERSSSVAHAG